jgi:hypothetical protein
LVARGKQAATDTEKSKYFDQLWSWDSVYSYYEKKS